MSNQASAPFTVPHHKLPHFVGRQEDLKRLDAALQQANPVGIRPAGLTGMGGIGKTQLAVRYAYDARDRQQYPDGIFWLNAARPLPDEFARLGEQLTVTQPLTASPAQLRDWLMDHFSVEEMRDLCANLGIYYDEFTPQRSAMAREMVAYCERRQRLSELVGAVRRARPQVAVPQRGGVDVSLAEQIEAAFRYLHAHPRALLVLDNLADPNVLHYPVSLDWVPAMLPCAVLFTTRQQQLAGFSPIELAVLPLPAALKLLLNHPARQPVLQPAHPEHATAQRICRLLGRLPLALEVAAAQLGKRPALPLGQYVAALEKQGVQVVTGGNIVAQQEVGLRATLQSQWDDLPHEECRLLLRVAGQLPEAEYIPAAQLGLLAGIAPQPDDLLAPGLAEVVQTVAAASLLEQLTAGNIRLHPLVRDFARQQTPPEQTTPFRLACAERLLLAYEDFPTLETHYQERGPDALQDDLLVALALADSEQLSVNSNQLSVDGGQSHSLTVSQSPNPSTSLRTSLQSPISNRLRLLLRILQQEIHNLRAAEVQQSEVGLMQQWLKRVTEMGTSWLIEKIKHKLKSKSIPYLQTQWLAKQESPELRYTLSEHTEIITAIAMTPDGNQAVSASQDDTLKVWDLTTGTVKHTLNINDYGIKTIAILPDEKQIAFATLHGNLKVWNLETNQVKQLLANREIVAVIPDSKHAIFTFAHTLQIWNLQLGHAEFTLSGHADRISAVVVTSDGKRVVSASIDGTLIIWDLDSGQAEHLLNACNDDEWIVSMSTAGNRLVSTSSHLNVKIWDLNTGGTERSLVDHENPLTILCMTADGKRLASACGEPLYQDGIVQIWNLDTGQVEYTIVGHESWITALAITPDGKQLLSASADNTLKIWDLETIQNQHLLNGHENGVNTLTIVPDGKWVISTSANFLLSTGNLKMWNVKTGQLKHDFSSDETFTSAFAITPNGKWAVSASTSSGSGTESLNLWDMETVRITRTFRVDTGYIGDLSITSNGKCGLSAAYSTLCIWDIETGQIKYTLNDHTDEIIDLAMTADGKRAISASMDNTLKVWNLSIGQVEYTLTNYDLVEALAMTPDGKWAVSGYEDGSLEVWNLDTGQAERTLSGHTALVTAVAMTPNGKRGFSASSDRTLKVWNLQTGELLASITLDGSVRCVAVAVDGATIVAGDAGGSIYCFTLVN